MFESLVKSPKKKSSSIINTIKIIKNKPLKSHEKPNEFPPTLPSPRSADQPGLTIALLCRGDDQTPWTKPWLYFSRETGGPRSLLRIQCFSSSTFCWSMGWCIGTVIIGVWVCIYIHILIIYACLDTYGTPLRGPKITPLKLHLNIV